jgi:methylated-DNA-[protein]-cysteine S-methyltransferase
MPEQLQLSLERIPTPIGELLMVTDRDGNLRAVDWADYEARMRRLLRLHYGEHGFALCEADSSIAVAQSATRASSALARYFAGELTALHGLPVETAGTPFQRKVWQALQMIPCGKTLSYAALAMQIGQPTAIRAVALANGANPVGIVVPCHRVIGSDGSLTGYGGGLHRKQWLLVHESAARTSMRAQPNPARQQNTLL